MFYVVPNSTCIYDLLQQATNKILPTYESQFIYVHCKERRIEKLLTGFSNLKKMTYAVVIRTRDYLSS